MRLRLETGEAYANSRDTIGWMPLFRTAQNGYESVVEVLLETGRADVGSKDG